MSDEDGYKCPKCGSDDLRVTACMVSGSMLLTAKGYDIDGSSDEEIVACMECDYESGIDEFTLPHKTHDWSDKQKIAFIKVQDLLSEMGLSNVEVAEMFSTLDSKESVYTLFTFSTGMWASKLHLCDKCRTPMEEVVGTGTYQCPRRC